MPVVKKLKFDLNGTGEETIIKVSVNSKGMFSADIPLYVRTVTHIVCSDEPTLQSALDKVTKAVFEYINAIQLEERVILIQVSRQRQEFLNNGIGMQLSYVVCDKIINGKNITYHVVDSDNRRLGNRITTSRSNWDKGVVGGESTEIPFTKEAFERIKDIHKKLENLTEQLQNICNDSSVLTLFLQNNSTLLLH